ncbi:hypothetical protein [Streptomyces sp. LN699]|uniref:hypothetical protein n=1 Tax=Streptomyces sp. LN699 TaxID=3112981 RepID=UPI0037133A4D
MGGVLPIVVVVIVTVVVGEGTIWAEWSAGSAGVAAFGGTMRSRSSTGAFSMPLSCVRIVARSSSSSSNQWSWKSV